MTHIKPTLQTLTDSQIEQVHYQALAILGRVGVRVDSERARKLFAKAGAKLEDDHTVKLSPQIVAAAIESAPSRVDIYDRNGKSIIHLDGEDQQQPYFGIGVTNLHYQEPQTDEIVPFTRAHMAAAVRLGHTLNAFDLVSTIGIINDVPPEVADFYETLEMVANTTKPLMLLVSEESNFPHVLDMLTDLHGDLPPKPFVVPYFNPITPLIINTATVDKMFATIERGLPFIYSSYGMAGATTPVTAGGTLALLTAELLAGLVLSQLIQPGTPIILGMLPAYFDMRQMLSFYAPQTFLLNLACAEMLAHYGLPHAGTSGSGNGWETDLVTAGEQWLNHLTAFTGKVGLVPFVGGNFDSLVFSPLTVAYVAEVIAAARSFSEGFALDVDIDEIEAVGPGGNFLTSESTLAHYRQMYRSAVFERLSLEAWREKGQPKALEQLRAHTLELMRNPKIPIDHDALIEKGEAFIQQFVQKNPCT
ncbi:MAG: trimethylamine methyltransferase family protein [Anaerolineales bacterium]|nr:trimethylamine methyltransferase family protein [Anaerolineales bacterium]